MKRTKINCTLPKFDETW